MYLPGGYESDEEDAFFSGYESADDIEEFVVSNDHKNDNNIHSIEEKLGNASPSIKKNILDDEGGFDFKDKTVDIISKNNNLTNFLNLINYPNLKISFNRDTFAKRVDTSDNLPTENQNECTENATNNKEIDKMRSALEIDRILFDEIKKNPNEDDEADLNQLWFTELLQSLKEENNVTMFNNILEDCWNQVINVYMTALYFIENLGKKVFHINLVLRSLTDLIHNKAMNKKIVDCSQLVKLKAFVYITKAQALPNNLNLFEKCFCLSTADKSIFIKIVRILLDHKEYVKASRCINLANLHDEFSVDEICFPLLFQGHSQELEKYLNGNKKQQEIFLSLLDALFENPDNLNSKIRELSVPKVRFELLGNKALMKLALRLAKLYNINDEVYKNINAIQIEKTIRYLVYRRFTLKDLVEEEWTDLIQSITKDNQKLQLFVLDALMEYNEFDEAYRIAELFNLPAHLLPAQINIKPTESLETKTITNVCDFNEEFFKLSLPFENIIWVDTENIFLSAITSIQKEGPFVGFDAEWRPNFTNISQAAHQVSIIQLATRDHIYLLDILTLKNLLSHSEWLKLGDDIFGCQDLIIIGYGCHTDFPNIFHTIPALKDCPNMCIIDLAQYHSLMQKENDEKSRGGLNDLTYRCLGVALDKRQQMSDWNRRPLRNNQILYAAIDAYSLLEIHEKLSKEFPELKTNQAKKKIRYSQSKMERKQMNASIHIMERPDRRQNEEYSGEKEGYKLLYCASSGPTPCENIRVICDNMLAGLGRSLRSCGLDVYPSNHNLDQRELVEISKKEKRIILSSGTPYYSLRQHVDHGSCINVIRGSIQDQLKQIIRLFNIQLSKDNILSRCQTCNSSDFFQIDSKNLIEIKNYLSPNLNGNISLNEKARDLCNLMKINKISIKFNDIPVEKYESVNLFFVCLGCGKIYWEGVHHNRTLNKFAFALK